MTLPFIFIGYSLLLISSFLDNIRGPLLPVLSEEMGLSYGSLSLFFVVGYLASVSVNYGLIRLTKYYGRVTLTLGAAGLVVVTALFALSVNRYFFLLILGGLMASALSAIGAMANLWVLAGTNTERRGAVFCGLHMMYGLGSLSAPAIVAFWIVRGWSWTGLPLLAGIASIALSSFVFLRFKDPKREVSSAAKDSEILVVVSNPSLQKLLIGVFSVYVAAEVITSAWMVSFLVHTQKLSVVEASPYLSGFFLAMAVTRALGFLFSNAKTEILWIYGSILFASVFFVLGISGYLWCFPLVGLLGPFFPLVIARASRVFPQEADRLILKILTSMQLMLAICNILVGWATDKWGVEWAYRFPLVCFAITGIGLFIYFQKEKFAVSTTLR